MSSINNKDMKMNIITIVKNYIREWIDEIPVFDDPSEGEKLLSGGKLYFYEVGTDILKNIYFDELLTVPFPNPVIADYQGEFPDVYLIGGHRIELFDSDEICIFISDTDDELTA